MHEINQRIPAHFVDKIKLFPEMVEQVSMTKDDIHTLIPAKGQVDWEKLPQTIMTL